MDNNSDDFFSIGMGFVTPGIETGVPKSDTSDKTECKDTCCDIKENCEEADNSINNDKENAQIVVETIEKDSDSAPEDTDNSLESYMDKEKRLKTFSVEEALHSILVTEDINSASQKELKAAANNLILAKKSISLYKRREISETDSPSDVILNNMIKSGVLIHTNFSYLKYKSESIQNIYSKLIELINGFNLSGDVGENISTLQLLDKDVINLFDTVVPGISVKIYAGDKNISDDLTRLNNFLKSIEGFEYIISNLFGIHCVSKDAPISTVVDSIELINNLVFTRNSLIDINLSDKFETAINNVKTITEKNDISVEFSNKLVLEKVTELIYVFTTIITNTITYFAEDVSKLYDSTVDSLIKEEKK